MKVQMRRIFWVLTFVVFMRSISRAEVIVVNGLTHEENVAAGDTIKGEILLENIGEASEDMKIYLTDYQFFFDGKTLYGDPGTVPRSNAKWIAFSPSQITVPAKEKAVINYVIQVPKADTLKGTYWSMIMVEIIPKALTEPIPEKSIAIESVVRYAIQMITHMGDSGTRMLKFLNSKLVKEEEQTNLQIDIENTGERMLRPQVWVELFNADGKSAGKYEGRQRRIYPGTSIRDEIDLSKVAAGQYKALVVADCGGDDIFGIQYTLKIEK